MAEQQHGTKRERRSWRAVLSFVLLSPVVLSLLVILVVARVTGAVALHFLMLIAWVPFGRRVLFVYSNSPIWKTHIETEVLPRLPATASVLNWSERSHWLFWSPSVLLFRFYAG